ncbi:hypothetical protein V499_07690 [Pseudogymnoascus sp. VKM F-103]|nr:hypothetical protein V499_07690 [Pseudogymnoascus sp. VKM F-103]
MPGGFHPTKEVFLSWPKPNYIDPETKGNQLLVVTIISTILAIASVLARIPTVGIAALLILTETKFRWFRHIWDVPLDEISGRQYHSWIVQVLCLKETNTVLGQSSALDSWLSHDLWAWTYVETNLLVICSAIPPMRVLFKRLVGHSKSHSASKIPVTNPFHGRSPSNQSNLADTSRNGASTEAIALRGMEPGTIQSPKSPKDEAKATRQFDRGHKVQKSERFSKVYLDKELPPVKEYRPDWA